MLSNTDNKLTFTEWVSENKTPLIVAGVVGFGGILAYAFRDKIRGAVGLSDGFHPCDRWESLEKQHLQWWDRQYYNKLLSEYRCLQSQPTLSKSDKKRVAELHKEMGLWLEGRGNDLGMANF